MNFKIVFGRQKLTFLLVALVMLAVPFSAGAFPIANTGEGLKVFVTSANPIIATYQGNSAAYSNDLYLENTGQFIFNNHGSAVGSTKDLGSFAIGTELLFRLHVNNTGYDYYTGPASRNPDNHFHARVQTDWMPNEALVSFEDLFNGPFDYNDLSFSFTNVSGSTAPPTGGNVVPEPGTMILVGLGLAAMGLVRRRQK